MKKRKLLLDKEIVTTSLTRTGDERGGKLLIDLTTALVTYVVTEVVTAITGDSDECTQGDSCVSCNGESCEASCGGTCGPSVCVCPTYWDVTCVGC